MFALLSTLALAQEPETPATDAPSTESAPAEAPAAEPAPAPAPEPQRAAPNPSAPDYLSGFNAGEMAGKQVPAGDFVLYGAGATLIASGMGCCAATAAGYLVEPERLKPRSGAAVPDKETFYAVPPAPAGTDAVQWQYGYVDGWTKGLQKKRAGRAFLGGSGATVATVGVVVVASVVLYGGLILALQNTGFSQEPVLGAGVP